MRTDAFPIAAANHPRFRAMELSKHGRRSVDCVALFLRPCSDNSLLIVIHQSSSLSLKVRWCSLYQVLSGKDLAILTEVAIFGMQAFFAI